MSQCSGSFYNRSNSSTNKACQCAAQAQDAADAAALYLANFKARYLGSFPSAPAQPFPPAPPFIEGALYFNSTSDSFFVWDGFNWIGVDIFGAAGGDLTGSYPNPQIAAGAIVDADINAAAAIALSKLATGALPSAITVSSSNIVDGTIVDADVSASAAIAGTKVSPNFGSQNITTTGTTSSGKFIPTSNTATGNGVYLPAANTVAVSTNGSERVRVSSTGNVGIGENNPQFSLVVNGGVRAKGGTPPGPLGSGNNGFAFTSPGDTDAGMFSSSDGSLEFFVNNLEIMRMFEDATGKRVGINVSATPVRQAALQIDSTPANPQGILLPRMTTTERDAIAATVPVGLLIFNTTTDKVQVRISTGVWSDLN